jgi:RimJ/RimL family protein N-acetyltransferase
MTTIAFNHPEAIRLISAAAKIPFIQGMHLCVATIGADGKVLGGVFFTDYNYASIQSHVASFAPNWLTQDLLYLMFDYPFMQVKCKKIILTIPSFNLQALAFASKLGFTSEAYIKDVFPNGGMCVLSMTKDDCRFLKMRPRQIKVVSYGKI